MSDYRVDFVELESGNIPFEKFMDSLSKAERAEIISMIDELKKKLSNSEKISTLVSKYIRDGIFELRIKHLNRISRTFYFFRVGKLIVFTHGFIKKTQSIPLIEITKAIKYKKIYEQRLK